MQGMRKIGKWIMVIGKRINKEKSITINANYIKLREEALKKKIYVTKVLTNRK